MKVGILQVSVGECISDANNYVDMQRVSYILGKYGWESFARYLFASYWNILRAQCIPAVWKQTWRISCCDFWYSLWERNEVAVRFFLSCGRRLSHKMFCNGCFAGISSSFKESVVCYDNKVKHKRLNVSQYILDNHGAVSVETAYEMAATIVQMV